ncbi:MAG: Ig-like domain-containing protein [Eubacteriales bacterium]|nr:Ig-like domain-containing protein [Eubacteriales bacterium]
MNRRRIGSLILALLMVFSIIQPSTVKAQEAGDKGDVPGDWAMPVEGTYDLKGHLKKMHIQYDGVGEKTIEFSLQFQSTVSPPGINHVDFHVDPRIKKYITKVEGKGKGALSLGESYVGFKDRTAAPGNHNKNVYRAKLDGINGLFTALPWGAQVYEAKIIVHLNKKVNELKALYPDRYYAFETRAVGTQGGSIDGEIIKIDRNSLNSATFVKFEDEILTEDESRWLRSNSTAVVEYESGGTLTTNKDNARSGAGRERVGFGKGVMRIKYYIYPHMMIWDSYNALIDQYKHYSFALNIDPKLKELIPADAKIRVNALRLYGGAYNHVELPLSYINNENQLRISIYGTANLNNEDKNTNQVTDPLVTNHNMYISADADGSLPTYLQIEIPIDETKAEQNFEYNQYNFQGFYYNRRGQLVKNSLVRTFTNAAKTDQMPGITAEGTALLWSDEVKGNSEYPGSEVYLVANPDLDSEGNGVPGTGKVIGQMTTTDKNFVLKTFEKDKQEYNPDNPNLFKDIVNPATGDFYKDGDKVYVFQAKPGRMMSKGIPVTLKEEQTNKPEIDPVFGRQLIQGGWGIEKYFRIVSGSVEKIHPESPVDIKMIWHGEGAQLVNAGTAQEAVSGGKQIGTFDAQRVAQGESVTQTGGNPYFIVNFDGTYSFIQDVGPKTSWNAKKAFQVGDIIEVVATEEHCKESVHSYFVITEEGAEAISRKPQVGILYPTLPDTDAPDKQIDSNFNKPNRDADKSFEIKVQGGAQYKVEYYPAGSTVPVTVTGRAGRGDAPDDWFSVYPQLPETGLQPGDIVKVYQRKQLGWLNSFAPESLPVERIVQQHPDEYFAYTIEIYLEGKEGPQETIYVHKDGQIYPNVEGVGAPILNYVQADAPELPFPTRLKDEVMRPERVAHNYVFNFEKSDRFPITVEKNYKAFWDKLAVSLEEANKAAFAGNKFKLYFDRDTNKWADLIIDAGENGHYTKTSLAASDEHPDVYMNEVDGKIANLTVKGIETNVIDDKSPTDELGEKQPRSLTWAEVKQDKGIVGVNITPVANPGYVFDKFIDVDADVETVLEDVTEIGRSTNLLAQYKVDENQKFGYEIRYVYNAGTEDAPDYKEVPGKANVQGAEPVETVITINQDPVDGFEVKADQPKALTVEYVEENGQNNDATTAAPAIRQVVQVEYQVAESQKPTIDNDVIYDTTEEIFGTASPYAGIKLYAMKDGEVYDPVTSRKIAEVMTDKDGHYTAKVENLVVGDRIVAVAKDPLKAEKLSDEKIVISDPDKYTGDVTINPIPKNGGEIVAGTITIADNPNKPGEPKPDLNGVVVEVYKKAASGTETLIGKTVANAEGNFYAAVSPALKAGETIVAKAKPKKSNLLTGEAIVAVDTQRLKDDIKEAEEFLARPDIGSFDSEKVKDLNTALTNGKALIDAEGNPNPGVTQDDVNAAADAIEDALKALSVNTAPFIDASDKVVYVGDVFDALAGVTVVDEQETNLNATVKSSTVPVNPTDNTLIEVGTYQVVYTVTDSGNKTREKAVTVMVLENDKAALKVAIAKGEAVLTDGKQYDPDQVEALKDAIANGKIVDGNPNATKTEIQNAKDAINTTLTEIAGDVQQSNAPVIDRARHGEVLVHGKLLDAENNPIANAEITIRDKATGKVLGIAKTDTTGNYSASVPELVDAQVIQATAVEEGKSPSDTVEKTVVPNTDKLTETIAKADDYVEGKTLDPNDPIDKTLIDALAHAKDIKAKAEQEPPAATQGEVDQANTDLENALKAKKKEDTAKVNTPTIDEPINNGAVTVTGNAVPGAEVTLTLPGGAKLTTDADPVSGAYVFENIQPALQGGETIQVTATVEDVESKPAVAKVVTDVNDLKAAIGEGETAMANANDPMTQEDKDLQAAIDAGKALIVDPTAEPPVAKEDVTQAQADAAAKKIRDAIKAKEAKDEETQAAEEKEQQRKNLIDKLQAAIDRGEAFKQDPTYTDVIPEDKDALEAALNTAKADLAKLQDPNWVNTNDPDEPKVDADIKDIDDAIANARTKSQKPEIDALKDGATTVTGTGHAGDTVTVTFPGGYKATATVETTGTWTVDAPKALAQGETITAVAKEDNPNKVASDAVEATVGVNTDGLEDAITTAKPVVEDPTFDPVNSKTDKKLDEAYKTANDVLEKAKVNDPATDQAAVDKAEKDLRDALKDKADLEAAKEAVEKAEADPTDANIQDAQDKVDKLPGSTDPAAPDYNKEKKDLQDRIDAINKTGEVTVNTPKNGENTVTGTAPAKSLVTVTMPDGGTYTKEADETGNFSIQTRPLKGGEKITVKAKDGNKPETAPVTVTVETDVNDLKAAIGEGETAMANANDPMTQEDKDLQAAIDAGKALIVDPTAEPPVAKEDVTQDQADAAAKKIRDAIKAKDLADATAAEKEAKRQDLITKLKEAIKRGEDFKADPNNDDVVTEDMAKLDTAIDKAKADLTKLEDPNWVNTLTPDEAAVDQDIKDIDDAIATARRKTEPPKIDSVKKGGTQVTGLTEAGAVVEITTPRGNGKVVANESGEYSFTADAPFEEGDIITAVATGPNKVASDAATTTVGVYTGDLNTAIANGEQALADNPNTPPTTADNKLQAAIDAGKALVDDKGEAKPGVTQKQVDDATAAINEAMDQKAAEDAVKALEDKQKAGQPITPEEIQDAQDKIDKLPGSVDPMAPDFNQDKKDLQDRLDKVKAMEDLKNVVEKGKEAVEKAKAEDKPESIINEAEKVIAEAEKVIANNGEDKTVEEIKTVTETVEEAINNLSKPFIIVTALGQIAAGNEQLTIRTNPGQATVKVNIKRAGAVVKTHEFVTPGTGIYSWSIGMALEAGDVLEMTANAQGYLETVTSDDVK